MLTPLVNLEFPNVAAIVLTASVNPIALRKAKIVYNFGLSECNNVNNTSMHIMQLFLFIL